ncbi:helix-turn-helix transcriptional regulator, partial [Streptomyces sp. NPDC058157]|uniref:helix-turn-helix domain-containing protein n=1 Tax=Streptomyces sp. NPDC058157 TaxID=3346360 RepID=UPI0036E9A101
VDSLLAADMAPADPAPAPPGSAPDTPAPAAPRDPGPDAGRPGPARRTPPAGPRAPSAPAGAAPAPLTDAEHRVAALAADGLPNRAIAGELAVTPRTVEQHLTKAYRKLGIRGRPQLATALERTATEEPT